MARHYRATSSGCLIFRLRKYSVRHSRFVLTPPVNIVKCVAEGRVHGFCRPGHAGDEVVLNLQDKKKPSSGAEQTASSKRKLS